MKRTLTQTNPYPKDASERRESILRSAYDSSVFEGARGLLPVLARLRSAKAVSMASATKSAKGR